MQGKLIVFEGVEGVGKTTQIQKTRDWLESQQIRPTRSIVTTREPGGTVLGKSLRQLLLDSHDQERIEPRTELLLYAADRAQHVESLIKPLLNQGTIILCDRFTDSTLAYQGYGRNLNLDLIYQLNQIATGGIQSDLTLWLDIDVEAGLARSQARGALDRMEKADIDFHRRVERGFQDLAKAHPHRIIRIDASLSPELVNHQIQGVLAQWFKAWEISLRNYSDDYSGD
ncbi:MAG: dTMP kinase [Oscillatoriales cyanobacterium RM2_1_1]|nr:dTMP kinase [Oscillatoriales cyanobacterium SM2_3_0]NJO46080.1 dTMP kinase [Oscillatoriales cyanobacterium RM2_1_1]